MAVYAVVPVKNLGVSKRRLSTVFNPQERRQLTLAMLEDVLNALKASVIDKTVVIGEDLQVKQMAEKMGAAYLEASRPGLNSAIEEATQWCTRHHANSVLVLPADVPSLSSKEINRIIELGKGNTAIVLSPSKNWGTNALCQNIPNLIPACFGPNSFLKHIKKAYSAGISVILHFSPGTTSDIDSAKDLKEFLKLKIPLLANKFCAKLQSAAKKHVNISTQQKNKEKIKTVSCEVLPLSGFLRLLLCI